MANDNIFFIFLLVLRFYWILFSTLL